MSEAHKDTITIKKEWLVYVAAIVAGVPGFIVINSWMEPTQVGVLKAVVASLSFAIAGGILGYWAKDVDPRSIR